ncbi:MAG: DUF423 domain-containing protein [Spirosomataceae bacterium]|nr:DUF423 domain-containing protein [Flectobacillus sp.]
MKNRFFLQAGCLIAGLSVALGAFGAHAFKNSLEAMGRVDTYETAARYQFFGGIALLIVGILSATYSHKSITWAGYLFLVGTIIFSGSLYLICATGVTLWGAVAPIGGLSLILGWASLCWGISTKKA